MKKLFMFAMALAVTLVYAESDDGIAAAREALLGGPAKAAAPAMAIRDTRITADHMEYNYKESVAILTDNVKVDAARR